MAGFEDDGIDGVAGTVGVAEDEVVEVAVGVEDGPDGVWVESEGGLGGLVWSDDDACSWEVLPSLSTEL